MHWTVLNCCDDTAVTPNSPPLCIHTYIHRFIDSFIHSSIHPFIHSSIHTFIHSYIHTFIHSYIHTFIHSYIHTFIHSYIHVSQQHAVRTHKHADARVAARTVQCLLKRCSCAPYCTVFPSRSLLCVPPLLRLTCGRSCTMLGFSQCDALFSKSYVSCCRMRS